MEQPLYGLTPDPGVGANHTMVSVPDKRFMEQPLYGLTPHPGVGANHTIVYFLVCSYGYYAWYSLYIP